MTRGVSLRGSLRVSLAALALLLAACGGASARPLAGLLEIPLGDSPQRGPADAWVTLVEFADFQCPYSGAEEGVLRALLADLPADVRLVYKHYPLYPSPHPDARAAAIAAECARRQGAGPDGLFWPMHDQLFQHQADLSKAALIGYAEVAGLELNAFGDCSDNQLPLERILADQSLGNSFGVGRTPTLAINGAPLVGAYSHEDLRARVDTALSAARASGIPRADYYRRAVLGQ